MRLFPSGPTCVPLGLPELDGTGWPDEAGVGRPGFAVATFSELGLRHAFDPEAHAVADELLDALLPLLATAGAAEDEPYLHKVFRTAARLGAGLAVVERTLPAPAPSTVDRRLAGALWQARRTLPALPPAQATAAAYLLLAGFCVGRSGSPVVAHLARSLRQRGG